MAMGSMDHEQGEVVICTVAKQREVSSSPCLGPQLQQKTTASAGSRGSTADSHRPSISLSSLHSFNLDALEELDHIEASVEACSREVQAWRPEIFEFQRTLQHAARNQGTVSLVKSLETGHFVAVKAMPQSWTTLSHTEHRQSHPHDPENPWMDLGIIRYLSMKAVPFVMKTLGIFMDTSGHWTYCVSEFATEGDLFGFVSQGLEPGAEREQDLQPFMVQIFSAVRWLHDQYIAHCDISMENILVTKEDGRFQVKLIDFSMAVTGQKVISSQRGKPSYQAPEMATSQFYDSFALDCFAMGVVLFCCAARIHPWLSTIPGRCKCFDYVTRHGHRKFWMSRKISKHPVVRTLNDVFSEGLKEVMEGLLALSPSERLSIEEIFSNGWFIGDGSTTETSFGS